MTAIELMDVSLSFGKKEILKHVSFSVDEGEIFSIFGKSGSGKTSILKLISGFYTPDSGKIIISENGIYTHNHKTATVWQSRALFPHLNVASNIAYGLKYQKISSSERRRTFDSIVNILHIEPLLERRIHTLSGGEQQKVALARALVVKPQILLLDEPFNGIDELFKDGLREELKDLFRTISCTYILVSHDIDDIYAMSDKIAIIEFGEIKQIGTPQEIYKNPKTELVARSFGKYNLIKAKIIGKDKEYYTLHSSLGLIKCSRDENSWNINDELFYLINPSDIYLSDHGDQKTSVILKNIEFKGSRFNILCKLSDGSLIKGEGFHNQFIHGSELSVNSPITISWDSSKSSLLKIN